MNVTLWIAAGLLAAVALLGGLTKTLVSTQELGRHESAAWTREFSPAFVKTPGALELCAAVGLVLPALVDVAPVMVPVTATCWVALMLGAMITHARLGQFRLILLNIVYLLVAAFVAWGRFGPASFAA